MKIVGVNHSGYNTTRNISSLPFKNYRIEKKRDFFKFPEHLYYRITGHTHPVLFNLHQDFGLVHCDLWHFFNTVSFTKKPWLTTFETMIPRYKGKYQETGVKLLAGKHCKKLIGMSQMAMNLQLDFIKREYPPYYDAIAEKLIVIHPAQKLLVQNYEQKQLPEALSFIIAGTEFFRKGGNEILAVFDKLLNEGKNIKLHIVSVMQFENSHATQADYDRAIGIIKKHSAHIKHYSYLPNEQVLHMMLKCHVALLPSYRETYGYSILEAQAAGCPVITTDILAFGEINNNNIGWLIPVPKDDMKRPLITNKEDRTQFSMLLEEGLEKHIRDIINNPAQIRTKALAAIDKIQAMHNPDKVAEQLEQIYNLALK